MPRSSARATVTFIGAVCIVASVFVAASAVSLRDRQEANKVLDRRLNVLDVVGLVDREAGHGREEITTLFEENIRSQVIELATGEPVPDIDPTTFDQRRAAQDPATSREAPDNLAGVNRLPIHAAVFELYEADALAAIVLPIEGYGLWSTLYGFIALERDARTVRGITFYEHLETPGLGGEVDNPRWKALWPGRKAFDESWEPQIEVIKGRAGSADEAPYQVDGLSGATITSRGVTHLLQFWLGDHGYGPFLQRYRDRMGGT